jgi:ferredoxin-NADP reductase/ferredoxin
MSPTQDEVIVFRGAQVVSQLPLVPGMVIGRGANASLQLEDPTLSRVHALVQRDGERWFLVDRSSFGTWLDGNRIEAGKPIELAPDSVAKLGEFLLQFKLGSPRPAPGTSADRPAPAAVRLPLEPPPSSSPLLEHLVDRHKDIPIWKDGTVQLRVADIIEETYDTKTFRLVGLSPLLFSFKPGQFVTLKLEIDGKPVSRSYSISSSPSRPHCLELTVKRVPGGLVSNWMCDHIKLGDVLSARGPAGKFSCFNFPSRKVLFIGGGSGITPVMSMLRWIVDTAADVDAYLFVSARTPRDIIFRNELNWMSSRHSGIRVGITCTGRCTGSDSWTGLTGRCDASMLRLVVPDLMERHLFMCGPEPFMEGVTDCLREIEFPIANLHTESFGKVRVAPGGEAKPRDVPKLVPQAVIQTSIAAASAPPAAPVAVAAAPIKGYKVTFLKSGKTVDTTGDAPLLDLAEANGVEIGYQCRSGSCGECIVLRTKGEVAVEDHCAIGDEEKAKGFIYACCTQPMSDLELDA